MVEEWEKAWLAAAIDGEGSISIYRRRRLNSFSPLLSVYNMSVDFCKEAQRIVSKIVGELCGGISVRDGGYGMYLLTRKDAVLKVCISIHAYLIIKKKNADRVVSWLRDGVEPRDVPHVVRSSDKFKGWRGDSERHRCAALKGKNNHLKGWRGDPERHRIAGAKRWQKQKKLDSSR